MLSRKEREERDAQRRFVEGIHYAGECEVCKRRDENLEPKRCREPECEACSVHYVCGPCYHSHEFECLVVNAAAGPAMPVVGPCECCAAVVRADAVCYRVPHSTKAHRPMCDMCYLLMLTVLPIDTKPEPQKPRRKVRTPISARPGRYGV
jgi:hypothetical protein